MRPAIAALLTGVVLVTGACAAQPPAGTAASATSAARTALDSVQVKGTDQAPALELASKPLTVGVTAARVVRPGSGTALTTANLLTVHYLIVNGKDGSQIESSYGSATASLALDDNKLLPGLRKGLVGQQVGSRVLVGVAPDDGFGDTGNSSIGVSGTDTVLFLVDVVASTTPLASAQGKAVAPKPGLPTVVPGKDLKTAAKITVPKTNPPKDLVVQPLIEGAGAKVAAKQTLRVAYTGVIWKSGRQFDSSATTDAGYASFPIGVGQVIKGWDAALVGRTVGSRILIVVPPKDGYGSTGQSAAGISGTDTLVFVVDILAAS